MKRNIRREAIIYFVNTVCRDDNNFNLRNCIKQLRDKKNAKVSLGSLNDYVKQANIVCINRKWDFSNQVNYTFSIQELENYDLSDKSLSEEEEDEEIEENDFLEEESQKKGSLFPDPIETGLSSSTNELTKLTRKIELSFSVVNMRLNKIITDIESINEDLEGLKLTNSKVLSSNKTEMTNSKVTLENYRSIAENLRDENFKAGFPSRTIVTSIRLNQLLRQQYEEFDLLHRLDNSDLFSALIHTFMMEQKQLPSENEVSS